LVFGPNLVNVTSHATETAAATIPKGKVFAALDAVAQLGALGYGRNRILLEYAFIGMGTLFVIQGQLLVV
jgi:hypothetical protein